MLRAADPGGGGGGGRPPVSIEVNFVTGNGKSAFDIEREKAAALKADLTEINGLMAGLGRGGGPGGGPAAGGGGGVVTGGGVATRGARPVIVPSSFNPASRTPAEQASGEMYGPPRAPFQPMYGPLRPQYGIGSSEPVPSWSSGLPAGHPARRDYGSQAYGPARPAMGMGSAGYEASAASLAAVNARNEAAAAARRMEANAAEVAAIRRASAATVAETAAIRAETAAIVAGGGTKAGMSAGFIGGAAAGLGAAVLGGIAANTPQGVSAIHGVGGWLEGATREQGFASQFARVAGTPLMWATGGRGINPVQAARGAILGDFVEEARTARGTSRADSNLWRQGLRMDLGDAIASQGVGIGLSGTPAKVAENASEFNRLQARLDRGSISNEDRLETVSALRQRNQERIGLSAQLDEENTLAPKRKELELSQQMLQHRMQERDAVESITKRRIDSLALESPGNLRKLERAVKDAQDGGSLDKRNAELLTARGMSGLFPAVREFNEEKVRSNAPNLAGVIAKHMADAQGELDRAVEQNAELMTSWAKLIETISKGQKELVEEVKKADSKLAEEGKTYAQEVADNAAAAGKTVANQPTVGPGASSF